MYIRKNFCAFIRYLEELDPELTNITSYMRKLDTFLFRILSVRITLLPFPDKESPFFPFMVSLLY